MSFPGAGVWKGQCSVTFIEGHQSDNKIGKYPFVMASQPSRLLCHHRRRRLLLTQDTASLPMLATLGCHIPRVLVAPTFHACTLCLVGTDGTVVIDQDVAGLSQLIHCLTLAREESVGQAHGIVLKCPDGVDVPSIDATSRRDQVVEWARRRVVARLVRVVAHPRVLGIPGLLRTLPRSYLAGYHATH